MITILSTVKYREKNKSIQYEKPCYRYTGWQFKNHKELDLFQKYIKSVHQSDWFVNIIDSN